MPPKGSRLPRQQHAMTDVDGRKRGKTSWGRPRGEGRQPPEGRLRQTRDTTRKRGIRLNSKTLEQGSPATPSEWGRWQPQSSECRRKHPAIRNICRENGQFFRGEEARPSSATKVGTLRSLAANVIGTRSGMNRHAPGEAAAS